MAVAGETTLEYTPTWVVAAVSTVIVAISFAVERILHYAGKYLKKKDQKPLYEALLKIKEELMLLGFISLLLTVSQDRIARICIPKRYSDRWLPCKKNKDDSSERSTSHFQTFFSSGGPPRLLADSEASASTSYCAKRNPSNRMVWLHSLMLLSIPVTIASRNCPCIPCGRKKNTRNLKAWIGKDPILSTTALHHLHIFIFVLAVVHVVFCVMTIVFGGVKIRQWKSWEDAISKKEYDPEEVLKTKFTNVRDHDFIKDRFRGVGKRVTLLGWVHSFFKQFYASVTRSDYTTLRLGFIMMHCRGNPKFNFHKYMIRALEADFKRVVGISWYLWIFVVVFLLLNVDGWHAYFWIAFIPFLLLLAVGTKLEHVITQLAHEVAEKHVAIEGDLVVQPSDDHFWFHRPQIVLILIHVILFQNSFELAFFFWIWVQYGFDSCIMGKLGFIIPRLVIGVFVQFLCSYSTLPLYAIVTQMGSSFKRAIFEEHIQKGLVGWAQKAKQKKGFKRNANGLNQVGPKEVSPAAAIQLAQVVEDQDQVDASTAAEGKGKGKGNNANVGEIHPATGLK